MCFPISQGRQQCRLGDPYSSAAWHASDQGRRRALGRPAAKMHFGSLFLGTFPCVALFQACTIDSLAARRVAKSNKNDPKAAPWRSSVITMLIRFPDILTPFKYASVLFSLPKKSATVPCAYASSKSREQGTREVSSSAINPSFESRHSRCTR